jgi:hypothetical protein
MMTHSIDLNSYIHINKVTVKGRQRQKGTCTTMTIGNDDTTALQGTSTFASQQQHEQQQEERHVVNREEVKSITRKYQVYEKTVNGRRIRRRQLCHVFASSVVVYIMLTLTLSSTITINTVQAVTGNSIIRRIQKGGGGGGENVVPTGKRSIRRRLTAKGSTTVDNQPKLQVPLDLPVHRLRQHQEEQQQSGNRLRRQQQQHQRRGEAIRRLDGPPEEPAASPMEGTGKGPNKDDKGDTKKSTGSSIDSKRSRAKKDNKKRVIPLAKFSIELGMPNKPKDDDKPQNGNGGDETTIVSPNIPGKDKEYVTLTVATVEDAIEGYLTKKMNIQDGDILTLTATEARAPTEAIERTDTVVHRYEFAGTVTLSSNDTASDTITGTSSVSIEQSILWRRQKTALLDLQEDLEESINTALQLDYAAATNSTSTSTNGSNSNSNTNSSAANIMSNSSAGGNDQGKNNSTTTIPSSNSSSTSNSSVISTDGNKTLPSYETVHVVGVDLENILDNSGKGGRRYPNSTDGESNNSSGTSTETKTSQSKTDPSALLYIAAATIAVATSGTMLFCFLVRSKTSKRNDITDIGQRGGTDPDDIHGDDDETVDGGAVYVGRQTTPATTRMPSGEATRERKQQDFWAAMSHGRRIGGFSRPGGGHQNATSTSKIQAKAYGNNNAVIIDDQPCDDNDDFPEYDVEANANAKPGKVRSDKASQSHSKSASQTNDGINHGTTGEKNKSSSKSKKLAAHNGYLQ